MLYWGLIPAMTFGSSAFGHSPPQRENRYSYFCLHLFSKWDSLVNNFREEKQLWFYVNKTDKWYISSS